MVEENKIKIKLCRRCMTKKPPHEFWVDKTKKDGRHTICILCKKEKRRKPKPPDGFKVCRKCQELKPLVEFYKAPSNKSGYRSWCKKCGSNDTIRWQRNNPNKYQLKLKKWKTTNPAKHKYHCIKSNCSRRKLDFNLDLEEFEKWYQETPHVCSYCNVTEQAIGSRLTIDRIDNTFGYALNNIVWACRICNLVKGNVFSAEEMKEIGQKYIRRKYVSSAPEGTKNDSSDGKLRMDLIPIEPLKELAKVYTIGAKKYGDRNYLKGMRWGRVFAALVRHLIEWWGGEKNDQEDGQHHLASVAWAAFTLMEYETLCPEFDDRRE